MAWLWIVVVLLAVAVAAIALMGIFTKTTSVTRGGVEHPDSVERHS